jgi:hypothetical protein
MTYNEVRYFRLMFEQNQLNTIPRQRIGSSYLIVLPNMTKYVLSVKKENKMVMLLKGHKRFKRATYLRLW